MPIDVLFAVTELGEAAHMIDERFGLSSIEGGRHPGWGTANRIVPLGDAYLELIAVVDPVEARISLFGRWIQKAVAGRPIGWAVRTRDIDAVGRRLGLAVESGSRTTPSGSVLRWRSAGVETAAAEPSLPFFIEWSADTTHPGTIGMHHRIGPVHLNRLEVRGDSRRLADWLGGEEPPVVVMPGDPGVSRVVLSANGRELVVP